jgi:hypothetical protein
LRRPQASSRANQREQHLVGRLKAGRRLGRGRLHDHSPQSIAEHPFQGQPRGLAAFVVRGGAFAHRPQQAAYGQEIARLIVASCGGAGIGKPEARSWQPDLIADRWLHHQDILGGHLPMNHAMRVEVPHHLEHLGAYGDRASSRHLGRADEGGDRLASRHLGDDEGTLLPGAEIQDPRQAGVPDVARDARLAIEAG